MQQNEHIKVVPEEYRASYVDEFSIEELDLVVNCKSHKGSSPGLSGFSNSALQVIYPAILLAL